MLKTCVLIVALFAIAGWLIAMEKTRGVLVLQIWMNGVNILLDLFFVLQLGWGREGKPIQRISHYAL